MQAYGERCSKVQTNYDKKNPPSASKDVAPLGFSLQILVNRHGWQVVARSKDFAL
jgi:hypothetical protein